MLPKDLESHISKHGTQMQFVKKANGETEWEITKVNGNDKNTVKGKGAPPETVMKSVQPEIDTIRKLMTGGLFTTDDTTKKLEQ